MTRDRDAAAARMRGLVGALVFVGVAAAALVVVRRFGARPAPTGTAVVAEHQHAGMTAASEAGRPVMLSAGDARRIGVTYAVATHEQVTHEVRAAGELLIEEASMRSIVTRVDGWVDRVLVDIPGRRVAAGDTLALIASPALMAAEEELLLAHRHHARVASLGGDTTRTNGAGALIDAARRRLRTLGAREQDIARVEQSGQPDRAFAILAPEHGVVIERLAVAGQAAAQGQNLFRIADLSTVWLEAEVFEQDLPAARVGTVATVELRALPGEERSGRVTFVSPMLDPSTRTARIRVALPNPRGDLKPGMFATVRFTAPGAPGVVSVPRSAVFATGERSIVFVRRSDGMLEPRLVVLGAANEARAQILRGLAAGDTVVASATFLVDAESNLGMALGGMGDMPGMDVTRPPVPPTSKKE